MTQVATEHPGDQAPDNTSVARRRLGAFQDFMARHLILSTQAPFPIKVRLICEAGQAVHWGSTAADNKIASAFRTLGAQTIAVESAYKWIDEERVVYSIRWLPSIIADDDAYQKWFQDWDGKDAFQSYEELELRDPKVSGVKTKLMALSDRERFLLRTRCLTEPGYGTVKAYFYQYAEEPAMKFFAEVSKRIDPTVFERALRTSRGEF